MLTTASIDTALLTQCMEHCRRYFPALQTFSVSQYGKLVFSHCPLETIALTDLQDLRSVTKSVISLLIGQAIEQGYIEDRHQPIEELLPTNLVSSIGQFDLTLHHLLSMTAGMPWRDNNLGFEPFLNRIVNSDNWAQAILTMPIKRSQIGRFQYNSALSHVLSIVLTEQTGTSAADFAETSLFGPLGIDEYQWQMDPAGYSIGGWGLELSNASLQKIGNLILNKGLTGKLQLVPALWLEQSITRHSQDYGYQWWLKSVAGTELFHASGLGGQMIIGIPSHHVCIVATSALRGRHQSLWPVVEKYWLPAIQT